MANRKINFRRRRFSYVRAARSQVCKDLYFVVPFHEMKDGLWKQCTCYSCASNARELFLPQSSFSTFTWHSTRTADPLWWDLKSLPLSWHLFHTHQWQTVSPLTTDDHVNSQVCALRMRVRGSSAFLSSQSAQNRPYKFVFFSKWFSILFASFSHLALPCVM